jgi:adenylate cyclase
VFPTGTVTFVFTDVVGSTRLWDRHHDAMLHAMEAHDALVARGIETHRGVLVKQTGDGAFAVFSSAFDAVEAAASIHLTIGARHWRPLPEFSIRIGVHTGEADLRAGDYFGAAVNRAARVMSLAGGGEMLLSLATQDVVRDRLPDWLALRDLGERELRGFSRSEHVFELVAETGDETLAPREPSASAVRRDQELRRATWIAVLPFENIGNDPDQEYFADGITEDLITALAAFRSLRVIARSTSFRYKGSAASIPEIAAEIGVRFVLEGSIRRAGNRVRVTAQLIKAADRHHLWADRFNADLENIFEVQERIATAIAVAVDPAIRVDAAERIQRSGPDNLEAWDHVQRGYWELWRYRQDSNVRARGHFSTAIALDAEYAEAHAGISFTQFLDAWLRWSDDPAGSLQRAYAAAKQAVALESRDALAHHALAMANYGMGRLDAAVRSDEEAIDLNPSLADAYMIGGVARSHGGDPEGGIRMLERGIELSPRSPAANWFYGGLAISHFIAGDRPRAIDHARKAIEIRYGYLYARVVLVGSLVELGRIDEARTELGTILELSPDFDPSFLDLYTFHDENDRRRLIAGLRSAGLER